MNISDIKLKYADDVDLLAEISRLESMERLAMVQNYKLHNVLHIDGVKDQIKKLDYTSVPECVPTAWILFDVTGKKVAATHSFDIAADWIAQGNKVEECYPLLAKQNKLAVWWKPRGIGKNWAIPNLKTGETVDGLVDDMSGFVRSRSDAYLAAAIFKGNAYVDFRPSEPKWIQVKISADEHILQTIYTLVTNNNNILTEDIIDAVLS